MNIADEIAEYGIALKVKIQQLEKLNEELRQQLNKKASEK